MGEDKKACSSLLAERLLDEDGGGGNKPRPEADADDDADDEEESCENDEIL